MTHRFFLPADFYGFSIAEMKGIVSKVKGVFLTDKKWEYDMLKKYTVQDIIGWHIKADTRKAMRAAREAIQQAVIKRDHPELAEKKPTFHWGKRSDKC